MKFRSSTFKNTKISHDIVFDTLKTVTIRTRALESREFIDFLLV
jgi:hypothetical protein